MNTTKLEAALFENESFGSDSEERKLGLVYLALVCVFLGGVYMNKYAKLTRKGKKRGIPHVHKWLSLISPLDIVYYLLTIKKHGAHVIDEYQQKYGKTYKIHSLAIKHYVTTDPDVIQKILTSTDYNYLGKPSFLKLLMKLVNLKDSIFSLNGDAWLYRRKLLSRPFSYKSIQSYLGTMNKNARLLIQDMNSTLLPVQNESDVFLMKDSDLFESKNLYTIRTASNIIMGAEISSQEDNIKFMENFRRTKDLAVFRLFRPWLISDTLYRLYKERKMFNDARDSAVGYIKKLIQTYKDEQESLQKEGRLIRFMEESQEEFEGIGRRPYRSMIEELLYAGLTEEEVLYEIVTLMIGGHETTMTAISTFILHMALNPEVQERCHEEIDELFLARTKAEDDDLTMDELQDLKYLERCLMECLRLTPSIPIFQRSVDIPLKIDEDREIEAGSNVLINLWTLQRDPEHFPDPMKFDPDRYLPENCKSRHKFAYIPFSWGMRNCIAMKLAMVEVKLAMAWILRNFEIWTKEPMKYEDIKFMYELTIKPEKDIDYLFRKKEKI